MLGKITIDKNGFLSKFVGFALSICIVTFILLFPFDIPNKIYFSLIFGVLSYALFEYVTDSQCRIIVRLNKYIRVTQFKDIFFVILYASSIAIVLCRSHSINQLYSSWFSIPPLNLMKLFSSVLLTTLFPGYGILRILLYITKQEFTKLEVFLFSFLLSFFVTSLVAFLCWVAYGTFGPFSDTFSVLNMVIMGLFLILIRRKRKQNEIKTIKHVTKRSLYSSLILVCLVLFIFLVNYSIHSPSPHIIGDEYRHLGLTMQLMSSWRSWQSSFTDVLTSCPYWLHLHLLTLIVLSGCPALNAYLTYLLIIPIPVLAFYYMIQTNFNDKKSTLPILATTIFTTFSGFGWFYALYLNENSKLQSQLLIIREASQKTFDVIYGTWLPVLMAPYVIDLAIFFVTIGLIRRKQINVKLQCILVTLLVAFGYLVHEINTVILVFLLFVLFLFNRRFIRFPRKICLSTFFGLLAVILIDLASPSKTYFPIKMLTHSGTSLLLLSCIILMAVSYIMLFLREKYGVKIGLRSNVKGLKTVLLIFVLFAYVVSTPLLLYSFPSFSQSLTPYIAPFYFFPLKLGIAGLFALLGIFFSLKQNTPKLNFFIILSLGALLIDFILRINLFAILKDMPEYRFFRDILWPFIVPIAAFGIIKMFEGINVAFPSRTTVTKYLTVCFVLSVIIIGGIPSHLLKTEYYTLSQENSSFTEGEYEALNFMHSLNIPSEECILTVTSPEKISASTGVQVYSLHSEYFKPFIFNSKGPETVLNMLNYLNIRYIYLTSKDISLLENSYKEAFLNWLIPFLPVVFKNQEVTIYEVTRLTPPIDVSNLAVVTQGLAASHELYTQRLNNAKWKDDHFVDGWKLESAKNVDSHNFTSDGDIAMIEAVTIPDKQAAVFYTKNIQIDTNDSPTVALKYMSYNSASYAIVDILYSDGTVQRVKGYMLSLQWKIICADLQPNKTVRAIRLGITDAYEGNGSTTKVFFDYIAFYKPPPSPISTWYLPILTVAVMQINYTTCDEFDFTQFKYKTLITSDLSCQESQMQQYLTWVSSGGQLIVLNSIKHGEFANFLQIVELNETCLVNRITNEKVSLILPLDISLKKSRTTDNETVTIACYSLHNYSCAPFAFYKTIGAGKIIYLETAPIFNTLDQCQDQTLKTSLFSALKETFNLLKQYVNLTQYDPIILEKNFYIKNIGKIHLDGETSLESTSMILVDEKFNVSSLDLSNCQYLANTTGNIISELKNATLSEYQIYGDALTTIDVRGSTVVSPSETGYYTLLTFKGVSNWTIDLQNNGKIEMVFENNGSTTVLIIQNGTLRMCTSNTEDGITMVLRNPSFNFHGSSGFDSLFGGWPYNIKSSGENISVEGCLRFSVRLSGGDGLLLRDFTFDGELHTAPKQNGWDEFNFPLSIVLTAIYLSALITSLLILYVIRESSSWTSHRSDEYANKNSFKHEEKMICS